MLEEEGNGGMGIFGRLACKPHHAPIFWVKIATLFSWEEREFHLLDSLVNQSNSSTIIE
jgi:hypothetical protein